MRYNLSTERGQRSEYIKRRKGRKTMKRFAGLILAAAVAVSMVGTVCGTETAQDTVMSTIETENFTFRISETIDSNNTIVRTYSPDNAAAESVSEDSIDSEELIKSVLLALGLEQDDIDMLSSDDLEDYLSSEYIVSSVSYSKTDNETGEVEYVDEATALTESAEINNAKATSFLQGVSLNSNVSDVYSDSYMRITYVAAYQGDAEFKFTSVSKWITMPFFRGTDSVGMCTMNATVVPNSYSATYTYSYRTSESTAQHVSSKTLSSSSFTKVLNGNWYGVGVTFTLTSDTSNMEVVGCKLTASYNAHVTTPTLKSYFNTTATYTHTTLLSLFSDLTIEFSAYGLGAAVTMSGITTKDVRGVELEVHYEP